MAIQNISSVIALAQQIKVHSDQSFDQTDPNQYQHYLPQFLWILRDFSLQLLDENGEAITAQEYLENSLLLQEGFSDEIEKKNRVRR